MFIYLYIRFFNFVLQRVIVNVNPLLKNAIKVSGLADVALEAYYYDRMHLKIKTSANESVQFEVPIVASNQIQMDCSSSAQKALGETLSLINRLLYNTAIGEGPVGCRKPGDIDY